MNQTTTIQSASLNYREGNSDKEYHAAIEPRGEGYIVTFAYGRRGNTLTTGSKTAHPVPLDEATKDFDKLVSPNSPRVTSPAVNPPTSISNQATRASTAASAACNDVFVAKPLSLDP